MPLSLRIEIEGGVYHIINRGNYRQNLFMDDGTHESFEKCLFESLEKYDWELVTGRYRDILNGMAEKNENFSYS